MRILRSIARARRDIPGHAAGSRRRAVGDLLEVLETAADGDPDTARTGAEAAAVRPRPRGPSVTATGAAAECTCSRARRSWDPATGICRRCGATVREVQIMDAVKAILIADPLCLLWRNEIGSSTHWPTGEVRKGPIRYGVANPGGADLLGLYGRGAVSERDMAAADLLEQSDLLDIAIRLRGGGGARFLAVECKTVRGQQSPDQVAFERYVTARGGVYALVRSEPAAADLLRWLRAGGCRMPQHLMGDGALTAATTVFATGALR